MICPTCKSSIRDDAAFCPVCGKPVQQDTPDIHNIETVELPKKDDYQTPSAQKTEAVQRTAAESAASAARADEKKVYQSGESSAQAGGAVRYENAQRSGRMARADQENRASRGSAAAGQGMSGQQNRAYHQYQRGAQQGAAPRQQPVNNRMGMSPQQPLKPLSEKEAGLLKRNLGKKATISFIFGIFGICSLTFDLPCAIIALVFSMIVKNEYKRRGLQKDTDLKLANAAFICAIIGIVISVIGLLIIMITGAGIVAALTSLASMASSSSGYYGF